MKTNSLIYIFMLAKYVASASYYTVNLKRVKLPCTPKTCQNMTICYSHENNCEPKDCLTDLLNNKKKISTISAMIGNTSYYEYSVKHALLIPPKRFSVTLSQQENGDGLYCEKPLTRSVSGTSMIVHLTNSKSFIDIELESVCAEKDCTGLVCDRCYNGPPDVKISVIQPVLKDDNVTIICGISPLTQDTEIVWFVSNGSVSNTIHNNAKYNVNNNKTINSSLLTIYSVQYTDELNYTCHATNVLKKRRSNPTQLHVFESLTVNVSNDAMLAKAGTNITIWCEVPMSSKSTGITWIMNGSIIQILNSTRYGGGTVSSPSLEISDVQLVDEGNYTCQATNPIDTRNKTVFLAIVLDPIANISSEPAILGNNITISCFVHLLTKETNITWLKDDKIIQIIGSEKYHGGTFSYPSLRIYYVQMEDEGNYTCQAPSPIGIMKSPPVFLSVISYPIVNISDIAPAKAGTNISISCYVPASSKATIITWLKDDVIMNITRHEKYGGGTVLSPSLQIYNLQLADEGNYTCQATNIIDMRRSQPVILTVILDPPVVSISEIIPAAIGSNITLICNITSLTEEIDVKWFKNSLILNISHTDTSHSIGGSVFLHFLTLNFLGVDDRGNYSCEATNEAGGGRSELVHLSLLENIIQGTSSLHTTATYIFSSYPSYSTNTLESSKTAYLNSYESAERTLSSTKIVKSLNHLPVPTASGKHIEPTYSVQTSATTSVNIHPSITSSALQGNSDNHSNVNAWIITTVVICIVEAIVITLVVYIRWLKRKDEMQRKTIDEQQEMMDNLTIGTQSVILGNGTYRGTPSFIMDNGTLRTQRSILPLYATMGRYHNPLMETDNPMSEDYLYSEINKDPRDNYPAIPNGGPRTEPSPVTEHPVSEDNPYTEINKVRRDTNPVVANGVIHSNHTENSNETPISEEKQPTEKENEETAEISNKTSILDGKQQTEKDKVSRDESPVIPNRMLPEVPNDEAANETEVTSL